MKRKVIDAKYLTPRLPISFTIALGLLLDRLHAPGWVWGVLGTLLAIWWVAAIVSFSCSEGVELCELLAGEYKSLRGWEKIWFDAAKEWAEQYAEGKECGKG